MIFVEDGSLQSPLDCLFESVTESIITATASSINSEYLLVLEAAS